jgi:hypothetical protein
LTLPGDHRELQAGQHDVLAVHRLAGRDVEQVDHRDVALADVAEGARLLEAQLVDVGRRHCGGVGGEFAVAELAAGRLVHDLVEPRLDLRDGNAPAPGGGGLKDVARPGADLPHRLDEVAHAAGAVGVLVAVGLLVARRLHDLHPRPVGLKLVGDDQRQGGAGGAGAHLGAVRDDVDGTVLLDRHEDMRVGHDAMGHGAGAGRIRMRGANGRQLSGEDEGRGTGGALEQAAAADVGDGHVLLIALTGHVHAPREAARTAAWMR